MSIPDDSAPDTAHANDTTVLSRRSFLAGGGTVLGVGALGIGGVVLGGATLAAEAQSTPPTTIGPAGGAPVSIGSPALAPIPPSAPLAEPIVRSSANGVLETTLRVAETTVQMGGTTVQAVCYEGTYPGPTLEVRPGDTIRVALRNDSTLPTNLHTHGFHVSPSGRSDNVFISIDPRTSFDYEYQLPANHPAGTNWYHAHHHTTSDLQVTGGQFGLIIVRGELDELPGMAGLQEKVLMISQTELKDGRIVDADDSSLSQQVTIVNGQYQPTIQIAPGEIQRWRILNVNPTFYRLELGGQKMHVVAYDGNALTAPRELDVLELGPGGRADVLVQGGPPGVTELRSLSFESFGAFWTANMVPVAQALVRVVSEGPAVSPPGQLPATLLPMKDLRGVAIDRRRTFRLEEREPRNTGLDDAYGYFINGTKFDHDVVNETIPLGATEEWEFRNLTYEPHPLHIHVNPFQVVAINGEAVDENHYRDTATIPPFGSLTIRHQFLDFTGKYVMHCHILFHEDHGMMQVLEVVP